MKSDTRDTRSLDLRLVEEFLAKVKLTPDPDHKLGCLYLFPEGRYRSYRACQSKCADKDGKIVLVSTHRAAYVLETGDHCGVDDYVSHLCWGTGMDGAPYCLNVEHMIKETVKEWERRCRRSQHLARMRKTLPHYLKGVA